MTPVPWSVYPGEVVEQVIGVLLCRRYPISNRVRPSQGDGGVDVLVPNGDGSSDVYQVKKFATNLTDKQKKQIEASLARAASNESLQLRAWHLAMPLNPTPENLVWFQSLEESVPFSTHWFGLDQVEGLTAEYPEVVDYYFRDGRERLESQLALMRDLLDLKRKPPAAEPVVVTVPEMQSELTAVFRAVNAVDPHYSYGLRVSAAGPRFAPEPGLVLSATMRNSVDPNAPWITTDVYALYDEAVLDRPTPLSFVPKLDGLDESERSAVQQSLMYGTALQMPVSNMTMDLPGGLGTDVSADGVVSLGPGYLSDSDPYRLRLQIAAPDNTVLAVVDMDMAPVTAGLLGGTRVSGTSAGCVFTFELLLDPLDQNGARSGKLGFSLNQLSGLAPIPAEVDVAFLSVLTSPNVLTILPEFGPAGEAATFEVPLPEPMITRRLQLMVTALSTLQRERDGSLRIPELDTIRGDELKVILQAGELAAGRPVSNRWDEWPTSIPFPSTPIPDERTDIILDGQWTPTIGDAVLDMGTVWFVLPGTRLEVEQIRGDGQVMVKARAADGEGVMITYPYDPREPR